ncbi:type IV pilus biogenesis protein PilP [Cupriavidus sp. UYPR2.512]|uniref:type IV pilus biogenesis protein PilP n=1 Tax=Cupriavidus sp. UYPR2.512 TaxID=1080187 RepID=UPI0009D9B1FF|nr:type IV pilus biogenesis protein PilP [Cupriavidus sp. UYPR2.512]UIF89229.1 type IV pilus biogenesis protein PilP [Cupriavidus necator]
MQNRAFNHRWTPAALAIVATVGLSAAIPANAASPMSNPVAAAIASAGGSPANTQGTAPSLPSPSATSATGNVAPTATTAPTVETAQPSRPTDAPELAALQSQLALWKARAEIAKYKAEVKRAEDSLIASPAGAAPGGGAPSISLAGPMPAGGVAERAPRIAPEAPRVVSLRAFDGHYTAVVDVSGRTIPVHAGDTLDGGWKVVSIDDGGVKLANGKRVRTLRP